MRSAKEPVMSAGVRIANVIWKKTKRSSGIEPESVSIEIPERKALSRPPMKAEPSEKASEYPTKYHTSVMTPQIATDCARVVRMFFLRTMPA